MLIKQIFTTFQPNAATVFTMLKMFGLDDVAQDLQAGSINRLSNVLTMTMSLRQSFDQFHFWLELVPGEVCTPNIIIFVYELDRISYILTMYMHMTICFPAF